MTRKLSALALLACALVACAAPRVSLREGPREYVAEDYEKVLSEWTRNEHLISVSELDDLLAATATFESWDFRWAYVVRFAQDYRLTLEQRQKLLRQTLDETREAHHFFVAIAGGERRFNDLTKENSAWIVRLIDSTGAETAPQEIVAIKKPNVTERTYYPYNTVFHLTFRISFPRTSPDGTPTISPDAEWFGLRFAGAQGDKELIWELDKDTQGPLKKDREKGDPEPSKPTAPADGAAKPS
ncbi:MAG: hypothetical protein U0414_41100 [Polyangiaceae bacterium]